MSQTKSTVRLGSTISFSSFGICLPSNSNMVSSYREARDPSKFSTRVLVRTKAEVRLHLGRIAPLLAVLLSRGAQLPSRFVQKSEINNLSCADRLRNFRLLPRQIDEVLHGFGSDDSVFGQATLQ